MFWKTASLFLLLLLLPFSTVSVPAERAKSVHNIIYPKVSYDDCVVDDAAELKEPGRCKRFGECADTLKMWESKNLELKTCYFVNFDHFVCCPLDKSNDTDQNRNIMELFEKKEKQDLRRILTCDDSYYDNVRSVDNGIPTKYREFPYMAALGWNSNFDNSIFYRCGGTLIYTNFVLTAAHCIDFGGAIPTRVSLGGGNLTAFEPSDNYAVQAIYIHPEYNAVSGYNDIALIQLVPRWESPGSDICLFDKKELLYQEVIAIGYGQTGFTGLPSTQLLKAPLLTVANVDCQQHYSKDLLPEGVLLSQLCAADIINNMRDTCQDDSGGPLLLQEIGKTFIVGITSQGHHCSLGPPGIYTRISHYVDWIVDTIWVARDFKYQ